VQTASDHMLPRVVALGVGKGWICSFVRSIACPLMLEVVDVFNLGFRDVESE